MTLFGVNYTRSAVPCPFQYEIESFFSTVESIPYDDSSSESEVSTETASSGATTSETTSNSSNVNLAINEFRRIKKDYPAAQGKYAYIYEYTDSQGNSCVLIRITYKLITDWEDMVLFAGGKRIPDPINYYKNLAARGYGNSRFMYMELERDVMVQIVKGNATAADLRAVDGAPPSQKPSSSYEEMTCPARNAGQVFL